MLKHVKVTVIAALAMVAMSAPAIGIAAAVLVLSAASAHAGPIVASELGCRTDLGTDRVATYTSTRHFRAAVFWEGTRGCAPTTDRAIGINHVWSREFFADGSESFTVYMDELKQYGCGRFQIDLQDVDGSGAFVGDNISTMVDTGIDCVTGLPVPPASTNTAAGETHRGPGDSPGVTPLTYTPPSTYTPNTPPLDTPPRTLPSVTVSSVTVPEAGSRWILVIGLAALAANRLGRGTRVSREIEHQPGRQSMPLGVAP